MTDKQYRIYKAVRKYRTLPKILESTGISDYPTLQDEAGIGMLDFSDNRMDEKTVVTLTDHAAEAYESRHRFNWKELRDWATLILALYGSVTATIALLK